MSPLGTIDGDQTMRGGSMPSATGDAEIGRERIEDVLVLRKRIGAALMGIAS